MSVYIPKGIKNNLLLFIVDITVRMAVSPYCVWLYGVNETVNETKIPVDTMNNLKEAHLQNR